MVGARLIPYRVVGTFAFSSSNPLIP